MEFICHFCVFQPQEQGPQRIDSSSFSFDVPAQVEEDTTTSLGLEEVEFGPGRASETNQTVTYTIQSIPEGSEGSIQLSDGTPVGRTSAWSIPRPED